MGHRRDTSGDVQRPSPLVYTADGDTTALAAKESWPQSSEILSSIRVCNLVRGSLVYKKTLPLAGLECKSQADIWGQGHSQVVLRSPGCFEPLGDFCHLAR